MRDARRRLIRVWLVLMSLTAAMALAADVTNASRLGPLGLLAIAAVTVLKTRLVLGDYLGLRANKPALNGLTAAIVLTMAVVTAAFIAIKA